MTRHDITKLLRDHHFAERVEVVRRRTAQYYEPWPRNGPTVPRHDDGTALWNLLHRGVPSPNRWGPGLTEQLVDLRLADGELRPGAWELTAFRGLLAARDRASQPGTGTVYLGEDSLRFTDTILDARPTGRALDIGCGSGITSCALARSCHHVTAVDLQDACVEATALSGVLNGTGERIRTWKGDFFTDFDTDVPFDCVAANLPYAPVPPALTYSPAGNGGADGLDLNRRLLRRARSILDPEDGMLVMRFQSLGDATGPVLLPEIREFAKATGHDVSVVADGRTVSPVRAALTAFLARRHNPLMAPGEVLAVVDEHLRRFQQPYYFACSLVSRAGGTGSVTFTDLSGSVSLDDELTAVPDAAPDATRVAERLYRGRIHDLPDGFWELGRREDVEAPLERLPELTRSLLDAPRRGVSGRELAASVFADRFAADATRARALYVTIEVLVDCLVDAGAARMRGAE